MDCFGIKEFLSRNCCSCRTDDSSSSDEVQITKISKISATGSVHSLLATAGNDGFVEQKKLPANGNDNLAYKGDDNEQKIAIQTYKDRVVDEQPRLKPNIAYDRQISDLSDFTPANEKGLTEMVMEEIEKSFSQEHDTQEPVNSFNGGNVETEQSPSIVKDAEPDTEDESEKDRTETALPIKNLLTGDSEWRNKLIQDLNDDEEYISSSEDEETVDESEQKKGQLGRSDSEINENTKSPDPVLNNSITTPVNSVKCGGIPVVIDAGSYEIKAGFAGEYTPTHRFRTVIGTRRSQIGEAYREQHGDALFGEEALSKHNALSLHYPIHDGKVDDWKNFEMIMDYTLCNVLKVDAKDHPLVITEPALVSKKQRERQLEVVMEALHCPMTQFSKQSVLSALSAGNDVAMVVSSGQGYTEIVPVYYGYAIHHAVKRVNVGGRHITEYLARLLLKEKGINFSHLADQIELDAIKQRYAEVKSADIFPTSAWNKMIHHELPDGGIVELGTEIYKCTEPIFSPELVGDGRSLGIVEAINQSLQEIDAELRSTMKSSVLLAGGNCCLRGFREQLSERLSDGKHSKKSKSGKNKSWHVTSCQHLTNSAWVGGSIYADDEAFRDVCVTDDLYFECGPSIIHRRCL